MPIAPNSLEARDIAYHLHSYSNPRHLAETGPLVISRGEGIHVYDTEGREYIEGVASLWYAALGFSEPRLIAAASEQMRKLPCYHSFGNKVCDVAIELAEALIGMAPVPMSKVYFACSGSEAHDTAMKIVRYVNNTLGRPDKKKIIAREKAYHGTTLATASLTGIARNHSSFDLPMAGVLHTDCPHHYRYALPGESEEEFAERLARNLEDLIVREGPQSIAAFWAEPVMGSGGILLPPRTYFERVQAILQKYDILFVVDEVICGFGRLGHMFGTQAYDLKPDMIVVAKALSSGYQPISALLVNERVSSAIAEGADRIGVFGHGFTYSAHPVAAAVALEAIRIYQEDQIVSHVRSVAPLLQQGLQKFADQPFVGEVRGMGLLAGIELVKNKTTKENFDAAVRAAFELERRCLEEGLIVRAIGETVAIAPPLIVTADQMADILAKVDRAMQATTASLQQHSGA